MSKSVTITLTNIKSNNTFNIQCNGSISQNVYSLDLKNSKISGKSCSSELNIRIDGLVSNLRIKYDSSNKWQFIEDAKFYPYEIKDKASTKVRLNEDKDNQYLDCIDNIALILNKTTEGSTNIYTRELPYNILRHGGSMSAVYVFSV